MSLSNLEQSTIEWAEDKGIFVKATPMSQAIKTLEECHEMLMAINKNDRPETKDAIGDQVVTLAIQAHMQGWTLEECWQSAYDVIAKRTGKMVNGQFVKDSEPAI
jgi:NTP pyrophosphatase (non-canonical NTP hydrolase)